MLAMNNLADREHYEEVADLIRTSVESLESAHIPVTIISIHRNLEGRVDLSDIREVAPEMYGSIPETLIACSGCKGEWCKGCVPDTSLFEEGKPVKRVKLYTSPNIYTVVSTFKGLEGDKDTYALRMTADDIHQGCSPIEMFPGETVEQKFYSEGDN